MLHPVLRDASHSASRARRARSSAGAGAESRRSCASFRDSTILTSDASASAAVISGTSRWRASGAPPPSSRRSVCTRKAGPSVYEREGGREREIPYNKGYLRASPSPTPRCVTLMMLKGPETAPQDVLLFNDTVFYNIKYGRMDATDKEVSSHWCLAATADGTRPVVLFCALSSVLRAYAILPADLTRFNGRCLLSALPFPS